jgi:hypothetical protein
MLLRYKKDKDSRAEALMPSQHRSLVKRESADLSQIVTPEATPSSEYIPILPMNGNDFSRASANDSVSASSSNVNETPLTQYGESALLENSSQSLRKKPLKFLRDFLCDCILCNQPMGKVKSSLNADANGRDPQYFDVLTNLCLMSSFFYMFLEM